MATNNEGSYEYKINLSTSSEPAGKLFDKFDLRKLLSLLKTLYTVHSCTYRKYIRASRISHDK